MAIFSSSSSTSPAIFSRTHQQQQKLFFLTSRVSVHLEKASYLKYKKKNIEIQVQEINQVMMRMTSWIDEQEMHNTDHLEILQE